MKCKKDAYPEGIVITEDICEINVQHLLNHTCERILKCVNMHSETNSNLTLHCKWGFDGSGSHSTYKQKFTNPEGKDDSLFLSSLVPLRLEDKNNGKIVWKNPRPSSIRFCRPIRLPWTHENDKVIKNEEKYISEQIDALEPFRFNCGLVNFSVYLTMVDGKVLNYIVLLKFNLKFI